VDWESVAPEQSVAALRELSSARFGGADLPGLVELARLAMRDGRRVRLENLPALPDWAAARVGAGDAVSGLINARARAAGGLAALLRPHRLAPRPAPGFLPAGLIGQLDVAQYAAFFEKINLAADDDPAEGDLDPGRLASSGQVISATVGGVVREVSRHVQDSWLGGPLYDDGGARKAFMDNLAAKAQAAAEAGFTFVLWTNVSRDDFRAARDGVPGEQGERVRQMRDWARANGILLAGVDEVSNASDPMKLGQEFRAQLARGGPDGIYMARKILASEFLTLFGGVSDDGTANEFGPGYAGDLERLAQAAARSGFAVVEDSSEQPSDAVRAAAAGSDGAKAYTAVLEQRLDRTYAELLATGDVRAGQQRSAGRDRDGGTGGSAAGRPDP
jgi:hypothetical protein